MQRRYATWGFFCFFLLLLQSSCLFGPSHVSGVRSFSRQEVYLANGVHYRVGELAPSWTRGKSKARVASYYQPSFASTIYTSAFCGKQFEDVRLAELATQLELGLENRNKARSAAVMLSKHEALRTDFQGKLDGSEVSVIAVVLKKAGCIFDFVLIQNNDASHDAVLDFERFYQGFELLPQKISTCPVKRWCS